LNQEEATRLVFVVSLPILKHAQALQLKVSQDILAFRVPNLYKLELGLPISIDPALTRSYFDCKLRKLFIVVTPQNKETEVVEEPVARVEIVDTKKLESDLLFDVI